MRVKKIEMQREIIRKINRSTKQSHRLFEKLIKNKKKKEFKSFIFVESLL